MSETNKIEETSVKPRPRTSQLSTNHTLYWRVFLPAAGLAFWLAMNTGFWLTEKYYINIPFISGDIARALMALFLVLWIVYVWKRLFSFYRVEVDTDYIYITNYWHNVRYPWEDVVGFEKKKSFMTDVVDVKLRASGRFGQVVRFLPGRDYDDWAVGRENAIEI